ncbi:Unknown protein sequence [Pseudomonas syringae pv. broussonetiae]|uniref:Uncharacterized protein n=1 Tax=Pseudomonas savastanoi TaxID=29438 RepID=A0A3M5J3Y5_PSESS|nr:hypothetical protein [Pseudomonas savastanoi]KPW47343.1 Unknown protein sequence [Pseudomonas syringae pv. broussonetiae]KWT09186.1 hypothetical protein AL047_17400 [Pseudomonas syringae pv. broussonetiae]RMT17923.1 hypothetical protein ALP51_00827 [Pseudomonas savastanoi]
MTLNIDDLLCENDLPFRHFCKSVPVKTPAITKVDKYVNSLKFRNYKCNPKHLLLIKRYRNDKIDKHEYIACHFLPNEAIDTHLDRLALGHRVETIGHSQWHFRRALKGIQPDEAELYFLENFSQLFSNIVDLDTGKNWKYEKSFTDSRFDLLYKKPLAEPASLYTTSLIEAMEPYTSQIPNCEIELIHESGKSSEPLKRGMFQTLKPHTMLMLREKGADKISCFIIIDSASCEVVGAFTNDSNPDRRAFLYALRLEQEDFVNQMV